MKDAVYKVTDMGIRLKKFRKNKKLTQEELAEILFVSVDSIRRYENGYTILSHDHIHRLCTVFSISADYFYFGSEKNFSLDEKSETINDIIKILYSIGNKEQQKVYDILKIVFLDKVA